MNEGRQIKEDCGVRCAVFHERELTEEVLKGSGRGAGYGHYGCVVKMIRDNLGRSSIKIGALE